MDGLVSGSVELELDFSARFAGLGIHSMAELGTFRGVWVVMC